MNRNTKGIRVVRTQLGKVKRKLANFNGVPPLVPFEFSVDSPVKTASDQKTLTVEGWLITKRDAPVKGVRVVYGGKTIQAMYGLDRIDVAKAFPDNPHAKKSGFSATIEVSNGELLLEIDTGKGYHQFYKTELRYSPEKLVRDIFNPKMAENWAEHQNLIENKNQYFFEEPIKESYTRMSKDPRLVAFYLPQFHPIQENDYVWGKNFTEWTNVTSDIPRFIGHVQPYLPKDTGFYDLRLHKNIEDQITMAKKHGIYGFCFYYYWFSGKRLLEQPIDDFIEHREWDFNFSICWANENWTKRWDGRDSEVIVAQKYKKDDPEKFIQDVEHILLDPRYIKEDGKPVLTVFRASELKDPERYTSVWRDYFRKKHNLELHLVSILSFQDKDPRTYGFDMALDFAPQSTFFKNDCFQEDKYPYIDIQDKLLDNNFEGMVADYRKIALNKKAHNYFDFPIYKCVTPSWDNDARKKGKGFVMHNQSPDIYGSWLNSILEIETSKRSDPLIFINAWNEWAEGAVLEPTRHHGRSVLNRTTEVLARYTTKKDNFPLYGIKKNKTDVAVIVHLYYTERWEQIREQLKYITEEYDLFVSLNTKDQAFAQTIKDFDQNTQIVFVPNRGRDVLPFIHIARRLDELGYKYVLKLHSKKSYHRTDGNDWFDDVISKLLPSSKAVSQALEALNKGVSLIGPAEHAVSLQRHMGSNQGHLTALLNKVEVAGVDKIVSNAEKYNYFGGTMFWVSLDLLRPLLELHLLPEDFESENGQIDGTLAHALERLFGVMALSHDGKLYQISAEGVMPARHLGADEKYKFAP